MTDRFQRLLPYYVLALFCLVSLFLRPILPPDETRYLTVAWEMFLAKSWFVPTLNFGPYHHKPPLLFWLIDIAWGLFGVGRASAMVVVFAISSLALHLTWRTGRALFPERAAIADRLPWLMLGNVVFVLYSSLILFDLLLTACVLAAFLAMLAFARGRGLRWVVLSGLFIGLGVLAKGPVMLIHIAWPVLLYPLWRTDRETVRPSAFYRGSGLALLAALVPVAVWLLPALLKTDGAFAYALLWEQSAGRISGNMEASHPRPFYFYFLLLPVSFMPWLLSPTFWRAAPLRQLARLRSDRAAEVRYLRLLMLWAAGIVATFSLISGKQPHYILPILPLTTIVLGWLMVGIPFAAIRRGALIVVSLITFGQAVGSIVFLPRYDLAPAAAFIAMHPDSPFAFAGRYQGEFGFLSRLHRPIDVVSTDEAEAWLTSHPDGYLIEYRRRPAGYFGREVLSMPYRDRHLSISAPDPEP